MNKSHSKKITVIYLKQIWNFQAFKTTIVFSEQRWSDSLTLRLLNNSFTLSKAELQLHWKIQVLQQHLFFYLRLFVPFIIYHIYHIYIITVLCNKQYLNPCLKSSTPHAVFKTPTISFDLWQQEPKNSFVDTETFHL